MPILWPQKLQFIKKPRLNAAYGVYIIATWDRDRILRPNFRVPRYGLA